MQGNCGLEEGHAFLRAIQSLEHASRVCQHTVMLGGNMLKSAVKSFLIYWLL